MLRDAFFAAMPPLHRPVSVYDCGKPNTCLVIIGERRNVGCPRGDEAPDAHTLRKLFAASGGYCENLACAREGNVGGSHSRFPRVYDRLYRVHRRRELADLTGVLVDPYDMSAEDVRHACNLYGTFDVAVKMNSQGSVTGAAEMAAASMGA
jgi:hypothetical protein